LKGSYALVLHLTDQGEITVGKLGTFRFEAGYYIYFGSALNSLEGRFQRHLRPDKKLHWHIDYLSRSAKIVEVWWTRNENRQECAWTQLALRDKNVIAPIRGFGSSDCRHCPTHLVYVLGLKQTREVLQRLKMESTEQIVKQNSGSLSLQSFLSDNRLV